MSFLRRELIDFALDRETRLQMEEQRAWIEREPSNPQPYFHLAQFYRMNGRQDEALGLLLHAVSLEGAPAGAHASLAEVYAVRADHAAAWRHARLAEESGEGSAVALLKRHGVPEPG
jgi:cytochrome c-type biogenesis protein CcmH/NrfG